MHFIHWAISPAYAYHFWNAGCFNWFLPSHMSSLSVHKEKGFCLGLPTSTMCRRPVSDVLWALPSESTPGSGIHLSPLAIVGSQEMVNKLASHKSLLVPAMNVLRSAGLSLDWDHKPLGQDWLSSLSSWAPCSGLDILSFCHTYVDWLTWC